MVEKLQRFYKIILFSILIFSLEFLKNFKKFYTEFSCLPDQTTVELPISRYSPKRFQFPWSLSTV